MTLKLCSTLAEIEWENFFSKGQLIESHISGIYSAIPTEEVICIQISLFLWT